MSTLNDKVNSAIMTLHQKNKKEWLSLKEIYDEVEVENKNTKINSTTIIEIIEKGCALSNKFNGKEFYISNEKNTELYKSVNYDKIHIINNISIGEIFTMKQLMEIFKISGQSGMMKTNTLNCLVLTTSESNGVYEDSLIQNDKIIYTGEGLIGDQTITKNNKTLYKSQETNIPVYLFTKDTAKRYIFEGRVELYDKPYQELEKDKKKKQRLVWKFPLKIVYQDEYIPNTYYKLSEIVSEIQEIEKNIEVEEISNDLLIEEGLLNIRKYRKTGKHLERNNKPDYVAQQIIKNKQGIISERKIYDCELKRLTEEKAFEQVKKMKELFENKKENEGFDILSFEKNENGEYVEKYIEVKSTKGNESIPIDITIDEIEFAKKHINNYYIYRIINSNSKKRYLKILKGKDLFEHYEFIPVSFKIYSK